MGQALCEMLGINRVQDQLSGDFSPGLVWGGEQTTSHVLPLRNRPEVVAVGAKQNGTSMSMQMKNTYASVCMCLCVKEGERKGRGMSIYEYIWELGVPQSH